MLAEENIFLSKKKKKKSPNQNYFVFQSMDVYLLFLEGGRKKLFTHLADFILVSSLIY